MFQDVSRCFKMFQDVSRLHIRTLLQCQIELPETSGLSLAITGNWKTVGHTTKTSGCQNAQQKHDIWSKSRKFHKMRQTKTGWWYTYPSKKI